MEWCKPNLIERTNKNQTQKTILSTSYVTLSSFQLYYSHILGVGFASNFLFRHLFLSEYTEWFAWSLLFSFSLSVCFWYLSDYPKWEKVITSWTILMIAGRERVNNYFQGFTAKKDEPGGVRTFWKRFDTNCSWIIAIYKCYKIETKRDLYYA